MNKLVPIALLLSGTFRVWRLLFIIIIIANLLFMRFLFKLIMYIAACLACALHYLLTYFTIIWMNSYIYACRLNSVV